MKHAVEQYHRGAGIQKQSIRPSFGKRNTIAQPRTAAAAVISKQQSGFCLWESFQPQFFEKLPTTAISSLTTSHLSPLNTILVTFFKGKKSMTGLWFSDFCHVPRPKKVLFKEKGEQSGLVGYQSHRQTFTGFKGLTYLHHRSLTWTWTLTFTCTPSIYMHSRGL